MPYPEVRGVSDPLCSPVKYRMWNKFDPSLSLKKAKTSDPESHVWVTENNLTCHFCQQRPSEELDLPQNSSGPLVSSSSLIRVLGSLLAVKRVYSRIRLPGADLGPTTRPGVILSRPLPISPALASLSIKWRVDSSCLQVAWRPTGDDRWEALS